MDTLAQEHIVLDPAILAGKPVIRGTRLSVEFVIGLLADGWSEAEVLENYPGIGHDDILACLALSWGREKIGTVTSPSWSWPHQNEVADHA